MSFVPVWPTWCACNVDKPMQMRHEVLSAVLMVLVVLVVLVVLCGYLNT
jgi:hypothetical protein